MGYQQLRGDEIVTIREIVLIEDFAERRHAMSALMAQMMPGLQNLARVLCSKNSVSRMDALSEDVASLVYMDAWQLLLKMEEDPFFADQVQNFGRFLYVNVRPKVRRFLDHATSTASGSINAQRRYREVQRTLSDLRKRGIEPDSARVIAETNARLRASRANPENEGILVSEADLNKPGVPVDLDLMADVSPGSPYADSYALHPAEGHDTVQEIIRRADLVSQTCGQVARLWLGDVMGSSSGNESGIVAWIARELSLTSKEVSAQIARVRSAAIEVAQAHGLGQN